MSFVFEQPRSSAGDTFAGGTATIGEIYEAARQNMLYVDNTLASQWALDEAISQRNAEVFRDTGVKLDMPFARQRRGFQNAGDVDGNAPAGQLLSNWQAKVAEAAARIPDQSVAARLNRSIEGDAIRIARDADERLAQTMASRGGVGKWIGALGGGLSGSMRDPINVLSMLVGGGPGAARTITGQILKTAATEALINGASELAMQPMVQSWRKQAGLPNGLDEALKNAGFAAAFGGAFGAVAGGAHAIASRLSGRALEAAGAIAADDARIAEPLRRTLQGDVAAAGETLPQIRDALPAEARGALDQAEQLQHLDASRPRSADPEIHDLNVTAAHKAIDSATPPAFKVDQAQVSRIVNDIAGAAPADAAAPRARSLAGFLIDHGGIQDHQGELAAIGANTVSEKFRGRLVKKEGMTLDQAREAAEQAGYIGRAGETQTTSVADLLSALDEDLRGNQVFAREDQAHAARAADAEAERAGLERTVSEIAATAGPGMDDAIIHQAARLSIDEGMHPLDALEHVLTHAEGDARPAVKAAYSGEILPGWSDAELEAASAGRGAEPFPEKGTPFDDPGKVDPELEISPAEIKQFAELGIPDDDGRVVSLADFMDDIKAGEDLASIVKACRA
ncbi:hypothetical protein MCHK_3001 [Mesorhizobium huakuii 7653R]|nr:hypothetical protein MCHK_3001 [Mesorhizobium huakuii 7653R]